MRKRLLIPFAIVALSIPATYGQELRKFEPGLMVGFTISYFSTPIDVADDPSLNWKKSFRLSGAAGFQSKILLTNVLSIRAELYLTSKGGVFERPAPGISSIGSTDAKYRRIYKLTYLEIPGLLQVNLSKDPYNYPFLLVGPAVGFNVGSALKQNDYSASGSGPFVDENYQSEPFPYAKAVLPSAVLGIGFRNESRLLMFRYQAALGSVYKPEPLDGNNMKTGMNTFMVMVGFVFPPEEKK